MVWLQWSRVHALRKVTSKDGTALAVDVVTTHGNMVDLPDIMSLTFVDSAAVTGSEEERK